MKVALITHEGGGISSVCLGLGRALSKKGISTTIFTSGQTTRGQKTECVDDNLNIVRLPSFGVAPRSVWFQLQNLRKLSLLLKDYTVLHGVSPDASFLMNAFLKRNLGKPFVSSIHLDPRAFQKAFVNSPISCWTLSDFGYHIAEFPLHSLMIDRVLNNSNHVVVCSRTVLQELRNYRNLDMEKTSVIYNGLDFDEIEKIRVEPIDDGIDFSIVYGGRLFWTKGAMFLLEAFEKLRHNFKNAHLRLFGKGPLEHRIRKFIVHEGLGECVHFQGYIPHENMLAEVKMSDVVVLPSLYEAQPMLAIEAFVCKKPVVVFDAPYAREIISHMTNGLLAKTADTEDLCDKIQMLLSDRKLRTKLGENAYDYAKKNHNINLQVEKYLKIYENVCI